MIDANFAASDEVAIDNPLGGHSLRCRRAAQDVRARFPKVPRTSTSNSGTTRSIESATSSGLWGANVAPMGVGVRSTITDRSTTQSSLQTTRAQFAPLGDPRRRNRTRRSKQLLQVSFRPAPAQFCQRSEGGSAALSCPQRCRGGSAPGRIATAHSGGSVEGVVAL
jgi:hypothetical protein